MLLVVAQIRFNLSASWTAFDHTVLTHGDLEVVRILMEKLVLASFDGPVVVKMSNA